MKEVSTIANDNKLGELLKKTAHDRQLSLRGFAAILGVSHSYVKKLMDGTNIRSNKPVNPSIDALLKIADALEIPRVEFLRQCGYLDIREDRDDAS